jgi:hypothetical protein
MKLETNRFQTPPNKIFIKIQSFNYERRKRKKNLHKQQKRSHHAFKNLCDFEENTLQKGKYKKEKKEETYQTGEKAQNVGMLILILLQKQKNKRPD